MTTGSVIAGRDEVGAIVSGPLSAIRKVIVSSPGLALALRIACRSEPSPPSRVVVTTVPPPLATIGDDTGGVDGDVAAGVVVVGVVDPPPVEPAGVGFPRVGGLGVGVG